MPRRPQLYDSDYETPAARVGKTSEMLVAEVARLTLERRRIRSSYAAWCDYVLEKQGFAPARHHRIMIDALQQISDGTIKKLMINTYPASAKSTYVSQLFAPYWFANHPGTQLICAANNLDLALSFSRAQRNYIEENRAVLGYGISPNQTNIAHWGTTNKSNIFCVGAGGAVLGRRADCLIIDDPYAKRDDAFSVTNREMIWRWFSSDLSSRLKPDGRTIIVMTRFHHNDLAAEIIAREPGEWHVIHLPALCEDPKSDLLGRQVGDPLWPEYHSKEWLQSKRNLAGENDWASQYQCRPTPEGGSLFMKDRFGIVEESEPGMTIRAWDLAGTTGGGDWTVGLRMTRGPAGLFYIDDVVRFRGDPRVVEESIVAVAHTDGRGVMVGLPQDPGQAGVAQVSYYQRKLAGFVVKIAKQSGSKEVRASPFASQWNGRNIRVVRAPWNEAYVRELEMYPAGRNDDQVDASSMAFNLLSDVKPAARIISAPFMTR